MNVGGDRPGLVERPGAHEADFGAPVLAEHRDLARRAAVDPLSAAVVAWDVDGLWLAAQQLHAIGLDQQVDHERATGLPLAVQAVAAVNEHRLGREPIADRSAGATTFAWRAHARTVAALSWSVLSELR